MIEGKLIYVRDFIPGDYEEKQRNKECLVFQQDRNGWYWGIERMEVGKYADTFRANVDSPGATFVLGGDEQLIVEEYEAFEARRQRTIQSILHMSDSEYNKRYLNHDWEETHNQ